MAKASWLGLFFVEQILADKHLHQLVPVDFADHAAGVVVIGDVGGILGQKIAYNLVDGVVALLRQGIKHAAENTAHIFFIIAGNCEFLRILIRHGLYLPGEISVILYPNFSRL